MSLNKYGSHIANKTHTAIIRNGHIDPTFLHECAKTQENCNNYFICFWHGCAQMVFFIFSTKGGHVAAVHWFSYWKWACDTCVLLIFLPRLDHMMKWLQFAKTPHLLWNLGIYMSMHVHLTPYIYSIPLHGCVQRYVALHTCSSHPSWGPILWLEWVHVSIHICLSTRLPTSAPYPLHSCMEMCASMCMSWSLLLCHSCLECIPALVHVYMFTWLPTSVLTPLYSFAQTCASLCSPMCMSQALVRICTWTSTWMHVHLTHYISSTP